MLFILPNPISELQHNPLTPKVCEPRSVPSTFNSSVVFILDSHLSLSMNLGARHEKYIAPIHLGE